MTNGLIIKGMIRFAGLSLMLAVIQVCWGWRCDDHRPPAVMPLRHCVLRTSSLRDLTQVVSSPPPSPMVVPNIRYKHTFDALDFWCSNDLQGMEAFEVHILFEFVQSYSACYILTAPGIKQIEDFILYTVFCPFLDE